MSSGWEKAMNFLLDTHVFLWMAAAPEKLSVKAEECILLLLTKEEHVWELGNLPQVHRDPFDRLLIAQSRYEKMDLISADDIVAKYETRVVW
jgi:PIN domain nuclease of toxin-antitoxin system